jgi:hypothetical protein
MVHRLNSYSNVGVEISDATITVLQIAGHDVSGFRCGSTWGKGETTGGVAAGPASK